MFDEIKKEETKVANTEQGSELSDDQLNDASGSGGSRATYLKYELTNVQVTAFDVNASGNDIAVDDDRLTMKNIGSSGQDG